MFRKISMIAVIAVASLFTSHVAHAQYGGLQLQVGGYSNGMRIGSYNYGDGFYNTYGNIYLNGYRNPYNNVFNRVYNNNGAYAGLYPNVGSSYGAPYYNAPVRPYPSRRYHYR